MRLLLRDLSSVRVSGPTTQPVGFGFLQLRGALGDAHLDIYMKQHQILMYFCNIPQRYWYYCNNSKEYSIDIALVLT